MFRTELRGKNRFTVVDQLEEGAVTGIKRLQHPNILKFVSFEKGVLTGIPACLPLRVEEMDLEELLLGLRDVCTVTKMCLKAGICFAEISAGLIGVSTACHPLREGRWVLVRLPSSKGATEETTVAAMMDLITNTLSKHWNAVPASLGCADITKTPIEQLEELLGALEAAQSDLNAALQLGDELPLRCLTDPSSLDEMYQRLHSVVLRMSEKGKVPLVERRILNWVLTPEHVAQPAASGLISLIFRLPLSETGRGVVNELIKSCLLSSDPALNMRLSLMLGVVGPFFTSEMLNLMVLSCHFNLYMLASAITNGWVDSAELRYSCSVIKGISLLMPELVRRRPSGFFSDELVVDIQHVLEAASTRADEIDGDMVRLVKDAVLLLVSLASFSPISKSVLSSLLCSGCVLQRDHMIHLINGYVSALAVDSSFLLPTYLRLAGLQDRSVREAACDGLVTLKQNMQLTIPAPISRPPPTSSTHFTPLGESFAQCVAHFPQVATRKAAQSDLGTLSQLSKLHQKVRLPQSHSNIVFRGGRDPKQFEVLCPVGL